MAMRVVVGLGGNALLRRGEPADIVGQFRRVREAVLALVPLCRDGHDLVITHGNGPQVGFLALQAEAYRAGSMPLDVLDAESEGMIGYLLEKELRRALPEREVAVLLTLVEVDAADPAFHLPTKPIGPVYPPSEGARLGRERGWPMVGGPQGLRRVVPSPVPRRIVELEAVRTLLDARHVVICAGGGGIPVVVARDGALRGVEAVVDKDRSAALLAEGVGADALLLLTDVPGVYEDFGTSRARLLRAIPARELRERLFDAGSMGPKAEAACRFVERTGGFAAIGALEDAPRILSGSAGTVVEPSPLFVPRTRPVAQAPGVENNHCLSKLSKEVT
jgi:carbamate kinase